MPLCSVLSASARSQSQSSAALCSASRAPITARSHTPSLGAGTVIFTREEDEHAGDNAATHRSRRVTVLSKFLLQACVWLSWFQVLVRSCLTGTRPVRSTCRGTGPTAQAFKEKQVRRWWGQLLCYSLADIPAAVLQPNSLLKGPDSANPPNQVFTRVRVSRSPQKPSAGSLPQWRILPQWIFTCHRNYLISLTTLWSSPPLCVYSPSALSPYCFPECFLSLLQIQQHSSSR